MLHSAYRFRVRIIFVVLCVCIVGILTRLYFLQVVHGEYYAQEAQKQYVRSAEGIFDRGDIFFTQKDGTRIAGASTRSGYMLTIDPTRIDDEDGYFSLLHTILPSLEKEDFLAHVHKKDDPYEEVARRLSDEEAKKVRALKLLGVQTYREQWRYYQGGTLASHALGFVGFDETSKQPIGMYGLERYWDTTLSRANDRSYVNFFAEIFAPRDEKKVVHEKNGDIVTTIEPTVQAELERTLASARAEWHAKELGGVVINPKTGAVYALAALPDFNPNEYAKVEDQHVFVNPLVENVYEMGSIIKPLAMAIGLDTKAVTPETSYHDTGKITIDGYTIGNYDGRARGNVSMQEVLNQSLNVGMAFVTQQVGGKVMGDRLRALGLGEETGIDLPFEARGLLNNLNNNREVEYITASFGQGIALTPIQTVRALCALGNGGVLPSPHLVEHIIADDGDDADITPNDTTRVFSQETSEEITRMLVHVVDTSLRNGTVKREHYAVAAKTGTAQIAKKGERGYYDDRYLHSFFGYFPAYNPQFLIFLYHVEPQGAKYASETLTTPFMNLTDFLIRYYNLPPDR